MGSADAVPGVSGGTIALILGIYERLLASLAAVVRPPWRWRRGEALAALRFLAPLLAGLGLAYWLVTRLLVGPKDAPGWMLRPETAPFCFAFFFGLVLASLGEPWRRIRRPRAGTWALAAAGALAAWFFVGLPHAAGAPATWMLFYGGALAICVMLLPGVSGSLLLVILGQYTTITGAVHDRELLPLVVTGAGVVTGLALFVPLLRRLLIARHDATMAVLTGLMAGSLRALWPWKSGYDVKKSALDNVAVAGNWPAVLGVAALGAGSVLVLRWIERRIEQAPPATAPASPPKEIA
jgi:putative membrane protein